MGLVDSIVKSNQGRIHVHDPWVTGEDLGNELGTFLGIYRGGLCLSGAHNDVWHSHNRALDFLQRCIAAASDELRVSAV
ncbi:hypothetical protein F5Y13DRAFT_173463 [Hypoxylon sp. FL1857]|nr:hypothetical protein F5Y13DRAFT_173463 [Hypoxylon sp. FL1857]